ncbi:hypothetical protein ACHAXR_013109 [Thalassiosira sp. AJA248-18]
MAKGKGKGRNNKKKKGGGARGSGNSTKNASSSSSSSSSSPGATLLKGEIPNFGERSKAIRANYQTLYSRYKSATRRFLDYMRKNVPQDIIGGDDAAASSVNFLLAAADWMAESSHVVDPIILKDLKLCIRMRTRVAQSMFGGGDVGHKYFLDVLVYCWTMMRLLPTSESTVQQDLDDETEEGSYSYDQNRFSVLGVDNGEMEEVEEDDAEMFPTSVLRPVSDTNKPVTLEELMRSDDRNDAVLFLFTLDELMSMISTQYEVLVKNIKNNRQQAIPESAIVEHLLEAAVTSNFAIQQVQQLEMELQTQHEHLTTPCRLLSTLVMPELTSNVDEILRNHARGGKKWKKQDIISFLGDSMQCYFQSPSDDWNRKDTIVQDFCSQYQVDHQGCDEIEKLFRGVQHIVLLEVPVKPEIKSMIPMRATLASAGQPSKSHSWLPRFEFIGGDRSIHHTIRLLQSFAGVIANTPENSKTYLNPKLVGMFGPSPWLTGRSKKIRDMDELLMSTILPSWIQMCRHGIVGKVQFPRESELSPLFMQLKSYVENPRKPVSWSLAFGVHAMLTGILEVDREFYEIIKVSKAVFGRFFAQTTNAVKLALKEKASDMQNSNVWKHNLCMVSFLESFGLEAFEERAMWNPLCAGTIFSILSFFGNLEAGSAVIDCQAQLRITLYLFHGLLINNIIHKGEIPLLDILYDSFKDCKALWQGALPRRGELTQRFWICFGMGLKESKQMAEKAQQFARDGRLPTDSFAECAKFCRGRKMTPIEPAELATSFRRICERDFSDVRDKYHTPEQRRNTRGSEQYLFAVRTNDTLDHLEKDLMLLSTNFMSVAYYLEQFVCSLGRILGWESCVKNEPGGTNMRQGFAILFAQHLLGALDFSKDPLNYQFLNVPMGICSSSWMKTFFERIPADNVLWFQAIPSDTGQVQYNT